MRWILFLLGLSYLWAQTTLDPPGDPAWGKKLFESQCALCHGQTGTGGRGPNLHRPKLDHAPDDGALRKLISEGINPEMPGAWQLSAREVASVAAYVRALGTVPVEPVAGDPGRGAKVYLSKGCVGCHMIRGEGSGYGPELTGIGARRNAAYLRESVVAPEASVPEGFLLVEVATNAGTTERGVRLNEDTFSIQLKDAKGEFHSYRKADLKDIRKLRGKSPMPSYAGGLTPDELTDLVAYLASLRGQS